METDFFRKEISKMIFGAKKQGFPYINLVSGDIHMKLGGYVHD